MPEPLLPAEAEAPAESEKTKEKPPAPAPTAAGDERTWRVEARAFGGVDYWPADVLTGYLGVNAAWFGGRWLGFSLSFAVPLPDNESLLPPRKIRLSRYRLELAWEPELWRTPAIALTGIAAAGAQLGFIQRTDVPNGRSNALGDLLLAAGIHAEWRASAWFSLFVRPQIYIVPSARRAQVLNAAGAVEEDAYSLVEITAAAGLAFIF